MGAAPGSPTIRIECQQPWLVAHLPARCMTLGWSLARPGFVKTSTVAWLEVRNADLTRDVDPLALLRRKLAEKGLEDSVAFMTARDVRRHHVAWRRAEDIEAVCLATVGLANGEAVGSRRVFEALPSTINTLVHVSRPMTEAAFIEALSIVAQARTAAILETAHLRSGPRITGTGTDCIVVAAPLGEPQLDCAGLHTAVGEAIGGATYDAVREGSEAWSAEQTALAT